MSKQAKSKGSPVTAATVENLFGIKPPALKVVAGSKDWGAREWALHYAAKGFAVFPLQGDAKVPFTAESHPGGHPLRGGQRRATRKREVIERWFSQFPDIGYGLLMDGHTGVDVDAHKDDRWEDELNYLFSFSGVPTTLAHRSARGGVHFIFKGVSRSRRWHCDLSPEEALIDIKSGPDAYLVGPGSRFAGGTYTLMHDAPIAELPEYVRQNIGVAVDTGEDGSAKWVCDPDLLFNVTAATEELKVQPAAVEGEHGDWHTFNVAAGVLDWGVSEEKCLELMLAHWNDRCTPPWDDEALERKIRNAAQYRKRNFGCRQAPQYEFEDIAAEVAEIIGGPKPKGDANAAAWPEPDASILDDRRGDLPEFPLDTLTPALRAWAKRAAHGANVTPAFVVVPALAIASSLIGTSRRVQASKSWSEPMTLWTMVIGVSGSGKSPGLKVSTRVLSDMMRRQEKKIAEQRAEHGTKEFLAYIANNEWKERVGEARAKGEPVPKKPAEAEKVEPFVEPRLFVNNATIERIAQLVAARRRGTLMIKDELSELFANLSRYGDGSDRQFWLEAWNGSSYVVERKSSAPIKLHYLLVGLTGGTQPYLLPAMFGGANDGFFQRFLCSYPEESGFKPLSNDVLEIDPEFYAAMQRLEDIPVGDGEMFVPEDRPLTVEALALFESFRERVHNGKAALGEGMEREAWTKMTGHALRLAGTLCYMDWAMRGSEEPFEIGAEFMTSATRLLTEYFWDHGRSALRQVGLSDRHARARHVLRWLLVKGQDTISVEDVRVHILGRRIDEEKCKELLQDLENAGWLRKQPAVKSRRGRPPLRWAVNPALIKQRK